jgi:hypothetical protein
VANLPPVHEIPTVINGNPGEVLKAAINEVVVLADAADARIGMEAGNDGIGVFHERWLWKLSVLGAVEDIIA